jgi:hypothetical protein
LRKVNSDLEVVGQLFSTAKKPTYQKSKDAGKLKNQKKPDE